MTVPDARTHPPLVAVVTPVYNGARYLEETLACVQAQTYPEIVHVVLDNASTDATPAIIARAQGRRAPIHTKRNAKTLPIMRNWTAALDLIPADAKYFRLLCADDLMAPDAIERMVALAEADEAINVVLSGEAIEGRTEVWRWPAGQEVFDGREAVAAYFRSERGVTAMQVLYRTAVLEMRRPFYDPRLTCGDLDALLAVMRMGKVGFVHAPLAHTREHDAALSATAMRRDFIHYPEWIWTLERHGPAVMDTADVVDLKRRFQRHYFRRMLRWGIAERRFALVADHLRRLAAFKLTPSPLDLADAVVDWPLKAMGLRPHWTGYPY